MADILVVDDDRETAEILQAALQLEGHTVRTAADGLSGLQAVDQRLPDVCILDVEMPVMSGPELSHRMLLEDLGKDQVPVLLASGIGDLPAVAAQVGTPYFLAKPYRLSILLALLRRVLVERCAPAPVHLGEARP
jgi:DNA-binding NtrC family response regulator